MMSPRLPPIFDRLGVRLALLLAVALFPLLVLAVMQSQTMRREAQARSEAALMGETLRAVSAKTRMIQQAEAEARLLAQIIVPVIDDPAACSEILREAKEVLPLASLVAYTRLNGDMDCSSDGRIFNFAGEPRFEMLAQQETTAYSVSSFGRVSNTSILSVAHPVRDELGRRIGFISFSLPHSNLAGLDEGNRLNMSDSDKPLIIMTFDRAGQILTSSSGLETAQDQIPEAPALDSFSGQQTRTFTALSRNGSPRVYSIVDLIPDQLYALGSWPANSLSAVGWIAYFPPILFPALMWGASLLVAYFAMQKMVIGHVRRLSRALSAFASGNRIVDDLDFDHAPREIRDLARSYEKMTETILHDEAELEDVIHHKEVLLREVHHRVKNNLQLIASIINMQLRRAHSPEARAMMKGLQERVISLATVHRGLYMTSGLTDIDAGELIRDIVRQMVRATDRPDRRLECETDIAAIRLTPDQAVPLSLLVTEAMTNAIKYASSDHGNPTLLVTLQQGEAQHARLEIRNSVSLSGPNVETGPVDVEGGLGSQLVAAFSQQLSGRLVVETPPGYHVLRLDFLIRPLNEGELRHEEAARKK